MPEPHEPTATESAEAAQALRSIQQRRTQAHDGTGSARWVDVLFGVLVFAMLAAPDFFGSGATRWLTPAVSALAVLYVVLLNTRRGSAVLGQRARLRRSEIYGRFALVSRVVILVCAAAAIVFALLQPDFGVHVPYWRTALGVVLGGALILFGGRMQRALASSATRERNTKGSALNGHI
ncbi:hypothetical protein ACFYWS_18295 [Streptomyces sp. NPDC002795]|uniref:hypothetical protein n=1 Tax=Streptomyces sp. NPDC002795 TaxID=3364665 RepID=UPI00368FC2CC